MALCLVGHMALIAPKTGWLFAVIGTLLASAGMLLACYYFEKRFLD